MSRRKIFSICGNYYDKRNVINCHYKSNSINVRNLIILIMLGDIESNPGPFWKKGEDLSENLQNIIDDQTDDLRDLRDTRIVCVINMQILVC